MTLWTKTEIKKLKTLIDRGRPTKEIARVLGRTPTAVRSQATRLGIHTNRPEGAHVAQARVFLAQTALTSRELAEKLGIERSNTARIIRALRREIHVASWDTDRTGPHAPRYRLGVADDAPKPPAKTRAEVWRNYVQRLKTTRPGAYMLRNRKPKADIAAHWIKKR